MNKKRIAAILIYLGLIAVCIIALYVVPSVRGMLEKTYIAEYGSIDVTDEVSAFIVRDETVYTADEPSKINRLADQGRLVKAGTRVVELSPDENAINKEKAEEQMPNSNADDAFPFGKYDGAMKELGDEVKVTKSGKTKTSGYVSYHIDGAETKLNSETMNILDSSEFEELADRDSLKLPKKDCGRGYPIFKITKNGKWYLVYYLSNKDAAKYEIGNAATIELDGTPTEAAISDVQEEGKKTKIVLSCKAYFKEFLNSRKLDTTVTLASAEGLVLKNSSIVEDPDGRPGVFVVNKLGEHIYKPVAIKANDGERSVVFSDIYVDQEGNFVETIGTYDEIIEEPSDEDIKNMKALIKEQKEKEAEEARKAKEAEEAAKAKAAEDAKKAAEEAEKAAKEAEEAAKKAEEAKAKADEYKKNSEGEKPKEDGN